MSQYRRGSNRAQTGGCGLSAKLVAVAFLGCQLMLDERELPAVHLDGGVEGAAPLAASPSSAEGGLERNADEGLEGNPEPSEPSDPSAAPVASGGAQEVVAPGPEPGSEEVAVVEHPGGIFRSDDELEVLRGVTAITGDLDITGAVTSLSALASLRRVNGALTIRETDALPTLEGLGKLEALDTLSLYSNAALTGLGGLELLTSAVNLEVGFNDVLVDLSGLKRLTRLDTLLLSGNAATDLADLEALTAVGNLEIRNTPLRDLTGLGNLSSVDSLTVAQNNALLSLRGLSTLTRLGYLNLFANPALIDVSGLPEGTAIGDLSVTNNDTLDNLSGFSGLGPTGNFFISDNRRLPACEAEELANRIARDALLVQVTRNCGAALCEPIEPAACNFLVRTGCEDLGCESAACPPGEECRTRCAQLDACVDASASCVTQEDPLCSERVGDDDNECSAEFDVGGGCDDALNRPVVVMRELVACLCRPGRLAEAGVYHAGGIFGADDELEALRGVEVIGGDLIIGGEVTSLAPLVSLKQIDGYLEVSNASRLTSLSGLDNLHSVGWFIEIANNPALQRVSGLGGLVSFPLRWTIANNAALTSLEGLEHATSNFTEFVISDNAALETLSGLENLSYTLGVILANNPALTSVSALAGLTRSNIAIADSPLLTSLEGLHNLTELSGLSLSGNHGLRNLDELSQLESLGSLSLSNNASLTDLSGLDSLSSFYGNLQVVDNPLLRACEVEHFRQRWPAPDVQSFVARGNCGAGLCEAIDPSACNFANRTGCESFGCASDDCPAGDFCRSRCLPIDSCLSANPSCITPDDPLCSESAGDASDACSAPVDAAGECDLDRAARVMRELVGCLCRPGRL